MLPRIVVFGSLASFLLPFISGCQFWETFLGCIGSVSLSYFSVLFFSRKRETLETAFFFWRHVACASERIFINIIAGLDDGTFCCVFLEETLFLLLLCLGCKKLGLVCIPRRRALLVSLASQETQFESNGFYFVWCLLVPRVTGARADLRTRLG